MKKLYHYSDLAGSHGWYGWYATPQDFRKAYPRAVRCLRTAHTGIAAPSGWRKTGNLAFDHCEPIPTMKDLIRALTP